MATETLAAIIRHREYPDPAAVVAQAVAGLSRSGPVRVVDLGSETRIYLEKRK